MWNIFFQQLVGQTTYNIMATVSGVGGSTSIHILATVSGTGKQRHADGSIYLGRCALSAQYGKMGYPHSADRSPPVTSVCALRTRLARPVPTPRRCVLGRPATHA